MSLPETIHPALAEALFARGYATLTPVQTSMLAEGIEESDLLVSAQTGSGKTVAFGMAIASTLLGDEADFGRPSAPLGLVIAPTRELAMQVQRELEWLYAATGATIISCVGGMDIRAERVALGKGAHIVVGTPGRLRDHITKRALNLQSIRAVVLDEADEMLDLGFREDLEFILDAAPDDRRTLMFSATVPRAIAELAKTFQRDAVRVTATAASERHADIEYQIVAVRNDEREHAIINMLLLHDSSNTIVFCHTRESVKHLTARLANRGFAVVALSGELTQAERTNALQAMRDGRARVCVATDVAARGIDLPNLDLVIHADVPSNPDTLLHRSGRTGRAGRKGICALIVPLHRRSVAARVLRSANLEASTRGAPTMAEIEAHNREQILATATAMSAPSEAEAPFVAELLARLTPEQLAAAYLRRELSARPAPEEVSDQQIGAFTEKSQRRDKRFLEAQEGASAAGFGERAPPMQDGAWFSMNIGRNRRADPKWLLPMICKAGDLTKRDIGSIKILDEETRFEISADKADAFAAAIARNGGNIENGISIRSADGAPPRQERKPYKAREEAPRKDYKPRDEAPRKPYAPRDEAPRKEWKPREAAPQQDAPRKEYKPREDAAAKPARDDGPRYKVRSDRGEKLDSRPAREVTPPVSDAPRPPRAAPVEGFKPKKKFEKPAGNPKDKGKPKYKNRAKVDPPADAGVKPRKTPKASYDPLS
jgi:ATP-dependent RNA helicase DeaD